MAIIEVKEIKYKDDKRWRVTFDNHVLALFTHMESANNFVNSSLCEEIIKHIFHRECKKNGIKEYCFGCSTD